MQTKVSHAGGSSPLAAMKSFVKGVLRPATAPTPKTSQASPESVPIRNPHYTHKGSSVARPISTGSASARVMRIQEKLLTSDTRTTSQRHTQQLHSAAAASGGRTQTSDDEGPENFAEVEQFASTSSQRVQQAQAQRTTAGKGGATAADAVGGAPAVAQSPRLAGESAMEMKQQRARMHEMHDSVDLQLSLDSVLDTAGMFKTAWMYDTVQERRAGTVIVRGMLRAVLWCR